MKRTQDGQTVHELGDKEPDWQALRAISDEAESLFEKGDMTPELYRGLLERAREACNGHTEFLESLSHYAPPGVD